MPYQYMVALASVTGRRRKPNRYTSLQNGLPVMPCDQVLGRPETSSLVSGNR